MFSRFVLSLSRFATLQGTFIILSLMAIGKTFVITVTTKSGFVLLEKLICFLCLLAFFDRVFPPLSGVFFEAALLIRLH